MVTPVMKPALSEARNETRWAMSSGRPSRVVRLCLLRAARTSAGTDPRGALVMETPGDAPTARMPCLPYWVAMLRVRALTALLDAPYMGRTRAGSIPSVELLL